MLLRETNGMMQMTNLCKLRLRQKCDKISCVCHFVGAVIHMEHPTILGMPGLLPGPGILMMSFCSKLAMTGSSLTRRNSLVTMEIHITM